MTAAAATGAGMTAQAATGITPARFADGAVTVDFLARAAMHSAYGLAIVSAMALAAVTTAARRRKRRGLLGRGQQPSSPSSYKDLP
ncbi:hypothetical protein [Streptomyces sp. NPDC057386]|uniref:hypothetical protein n=1 Tax=unclassified Streptomyces TaxID=2593676 RepID=UPI0036353AFF